MQFTDRDLFYTDRMWSSRSVQNSTDWNHSLTVRYSAGVLDNPQWQGSDFKVALVYLSSPEIKIKGYVLSG